MASTPSSNRSKRSQRRQRDAVGVALLLVPAGTKAELEPAAGDDVDGGGHVGQHGRVPVHHAGYLAAEPDPPRGLRYGGQHRPGLEVRPGQVTAQRIEVIPVPRRLEQGDLVRRDPRVAELFPRLMLGPCLDREAHVRCVPFFAGQQNGSGSRAPILNRTPLYKYLDIEIL